MAGIVSVSRIDLAQRRQRLRRQRRMKLFQAIWRTSAVCSLASGLLWVAIQPIWVLKTPAQIVMKSNNQIISEKTIQSLLVLSYPQSLWRIEPAAIAQSLQQQPMIAQASVNRRLFPPGLIIDVKERIPVAIAPISKAESTLVCNKNSALPGNSSSKIPQGCEQNSNTSNKQIVIGLLDSSGVWMPLEKYKSLNPNGKLPSLKVIGSPAQYRSYWTQLYQAISQSTVKITEVDCRNPKNLILKTELGKVHLGGSTIQLIEQIRVLVQMRHLSTKLNPNQIEYIDLKNPNSPLVQMIQEIPRLNAKDTSQKIH